MDPLHNSEELPPIELSVGERPDSCKIIIKQYHVTMSPATVKHIVGAVVLLVNELVDRLRTIHDLVDQRFTEQIFIGPSGLSLTATPILLFRPHSGYRWLQRRNNIFSVFLNHSGAHMAIFAHFTSAVSRIFSCFVQFTRSGEEKQSKNTCFSYKSE